MSGVRKDGELTSFLQSLHVSFIYTLSSGPEVSSKF